MLHPVWVSAMTKLVAILLVSGTLMVLPAAAPAQDETWVETPGGSSEAPSTQAPSEQPPAPPSQMPAPPAQQPQPQAQAQVPSTAGQWVYTQQYGWIWMPYSDTYVYSPPTGYGEPYAYVYYPTYGWLWVAAPWVWGYGPWPYFGVYGAVSFGWYGAGWWRYPYHYHYAPYYGGYYGGHYGGGGVPSYRPPGGTFPRPGPAYHPGGPGWGARPGVPAYHSAPLARYGGAAPFMGGVRGGSFGGAHPGGMSHGGGFGGHTGGFGGHAGGRGGGGHGGHGR